MYYNVCIGYRAHCVSIIISIKNKEKFRNVLYRERDIMCNKLNGRIPIRRSSISPQWYFYCHRSISRLN